MAATALREGRLLLVSKRAAPDVFHLPGGKPDPGEEPRETLRRELAEELGVRPSDPRPLTESAGPAALEGAPMPLTVYEAGIDGPPRPGGHGR
ncbi:NUDIX domain-containing protein [Streptomyces sp. NBC_00448]|uniref:NUDIX domain-containing protein n=1 Tax=Streptomyces sp. NBC_00448 TaxID=2903652 RepID=UPI002E222C81